MSYSSSNNQAPLALRRFCYAALATWMKQLGLDVEPIELAGIVLDTLRAEEARFTNNQQP